MGDRESSCSALGAPREKCRKDVARGTEKKKGGQKTSQAKNRPNPFCGPIASFKQNNSAAKRGKKLPQEDRRKRCCQARPLQLCLLRKTGKKKKKARVLSAVWVLTSIWGHPRPAD